MTREQKNMSREYQNSTQIFRQQGQLLWELRNWFNTNGYSEVYTPAIVNSPAMEEHLEAISIEGKWLHTSPEFAMKKMLAQGLCRIYQISSCYRKEEVGRHHSLEFRMLEWYRVGASMYDLMDETVDLISYLNATLSKPTPCFERIATAELLDPDLSPEEWFFQWVDQIEPNLPPACIVYDYPGWQSALARKRGAVASRFEVYYKGIELANAFDEEPSSDEILQRWEHNNQQRKKAQRSPYTIDHDFLKALEKMPRCSGIAMGLDRLLMGLLDLERIQTIQTGEWE